MCCVRDQSQKVRAAVRMRRYLKKKTVKDSKLYGLSLYNIFKNIYFSFYYYQKSTALFRDVNDWCHNK